VVTSEVLFTSVGSVAFLTFNRPETRNALTWAMYDALAEACDRVDADGNVRVFVVRSAAGAFASGTDINQFAGFTSGADGIAYERRVENVIDRLERVPVPTIAQVEGVAAGAGCVIAFACDLRVCTPSAQFGIPIARTLGNCLSGANTARLLDLVGPGVTKDLMFTGRLLSATEAAALGLVARMAGPERIDEAVRELADEIAANAPLTIRATKDIVRRIAVHRRLAASDADDLILSCYASEDFQEGVAAFIAKRKPVFRGT
jgi:enoyl-CoA hydratase